MSEHETGQVAASAAQIYEQFFVPALFAEWAPRVLAAAGVQGGDRVLDVACGTGIVARTAAQMVGERGAVVGIDVNDGMLAVAHKTSASVTWTHGAAESLPFDVASFDRVVSQFGLMFFQDQVKAIAEMLRVVRPGGRVSVAVWAPLAATPGYAAVAEMLNDLFGAQIARSIEAPYSLGDTQLLKKLFADAGATDMSVQTLPGTARFGSIEQWMHTDVRGWTLADAIDDAGYARLLREAQRRLKQFVLADGSVAFEAPAHIVSVAA